MNNNNNIHCTNRDLPKFQVAGLTAAIALAATSAWAGDTIEFDNGTTIDWTLTTSYGVGVRLGDQDKDLLTANGDDGNRNFDRGSLTTNRVGALGEMIVRKDNYGAVVRASTFYDDVYHQSNDNDSPATVNKFGDNDEFTSSTKHFSGGRSRFLDAYVFSGWRFDNGSALDMKAGRHVESWGESLYYPGVSGAQSPTDAVKAAQPGAEVKEILLPVGQVSAAYRFNPQLTLSAYVQYEWKGTELPPVGSYLSTTDVVGPGAEFILGPSGKINYKGRDEPRDDGQWGVQVRYRPNPNWELSLFHVNYHDKNPATAMVDYRIQQVAPGRFAGIPDGYRVIYFEDIKLTGVSASTKIGDTQVAGEWSYRDGVPVQVNTGLGLTPARGKGQQIQFSAMRILGDRPWASQTTLTGEIVHVRVDSVEATSAAPNLLALGNSLIPPFMRPLVQPSDDFTFKTASAWKTESATHYTLGASFSYPGVFEGWDLEVPVRFSHAVQGASPMAGSFSGVQGDRRISVGTTFKYLGNLEMALTYVGFLGEADPVKRQLADRDYAAFSMKYSF